MHPLLLFLDSSFDVLQSRHATAAYAAVRAAYSQDWALYRRHCLHTPNRRNAGSIGATLRKSLETSIYSKIATPSTYFFRLIPYKPKVDCTLAP